MADIRSFFGKQPSKLGSPGPTSPKSTGDCEKKTAAVQKHKRSDSSASGSQSDSEKPAQKKTKSSPTASVKTVKKWMKELNIELIFQTEKETDTVNKIWCSVCKETHSDLPAEKTSSDNLGAYNRQVRMTSHWGEIPDIPDTDPSVAAIEREQMIKLRPMEIEGPRLHQPSSRHYPPTNEPLSAEQFQIDPLVLHTIQLLQHARRLRSLIHTIHQHQQQLQQDKVIDFDTTYPDAPPIPQFVGRTPVKQELSHPVPFMNKDMESDFVLGKGERLPQIDEVACRHLLRRSVSAILAHTGFDSCNESLLETMTDLCGEYFLQFTKHLRAAADNLALNESSGFPDIIEQVFQEMKLGSVSCLHEFYHKRVINYHQNTEDLCQQLEVEYEKLKEPMLQQKAPDTLSVIRIKEEPSEIHFPELDEIDEVNNPEQLLNLNDLGGFEITVEHESASGLTTEVESKWSQVKAEQGENKSVNLDNFDESSNAIKEEPRSVSSSDVDDSINDPPSITVADIMSPTSLPSKAKKKKKS